MHKRVWPERGLAGVSGINKPACTIANRHGVARAQLHEQIVWMLAIDQRLAFVSFTGLEKQRRAAWRKREWLSAQHTAQLEGPRAGAPDGRRHKPVCRLKLSHTSWSTLAIDARDEVVMKHQQPLA